MDLRIRKYMVLQHFLPPPLFLHLALHHLQALVLEALHYFPLQTCLIATVSIATWCRWYGSTRSAVIIIIIMAAEKSCFSPLVEWKEAEVKNFNTAKDYQESSTITQCSRSSPVTAENYGKLVLNRSRLKKHCRNSVDPDVRKRLWLDVVEVTDADSVLLVKAFGEPDEGQWDWGYR